MTDSLIITGEDEVLDECFCSRKPLVEQLREIADEFAALDASFHNMNGVKQWPVHPAITKLLVLVAKIEGEKHEKTG
jgi:hypothetical protein